MHDLVERLLRRRPQSETKHRFLRFSWASSKDSHASDSPIDGTPSLSASSSTVTSQTITVGKPTKRTWLRPTRWFRLASKHDETLPAPLWEDDHLLLRQCIQVALAPQLQFDTQPKRWSMGMVEVGQDAWLDYHIRTPQQQNQHYDPFQERYHFHPPKPPSMPPPPSIQAPQTRNHVSPRHKKRPASASQFILLTSIPEVDSQITLDQ